MEKLMRRASFPPLCLICGVDSGPVRNFMILFIGGLVLASIALLTWAAVTGRFKEDGKASLSIEAERKEPT